MARNKKHPIRKVIGLLGLILLVTVVGRAQAPIMETKPRTPVLTGLDVNPLSGAVKLSWTGVPSDPRVPDATGYIIYKQVVNAAGQVNYDPVAEVDATTFSYTDLNGGANKAQVTYRIAARGPAEPSEMTPPHSSIFLELDYDACANRVSLKWSPYVGWGNRVEQYVLYSGENANWEDYQAVKSFRGTVTTYTTQVPANKRYFYYIKAQRKSEEIQWTTSNLVEIRTRSQRKPNKLHLDTIISTPTSNRLTFTIDQQSELKHYVITRTDDARHRIAPIEVARFTDPSTNYWEDTIGSRGLQSVNRYYRIAGIDECDEEVDSSRVANSITLRVFHRGNDVQILWDTLLVQNPNTAMYKIYRTVMANDPLNSKTEEIATFRSWDKIQEYKDDVSLFRGKGNTGQYCYYVKAWEIKGMQRERMSQSSEQCTQVSPEVLLPTAIAPLERGQVNAYTQHTRNLFQPLTSYQSSFRLTVYNRDGAVVFNGNKGWDGILPNGTFAPEGAYVYRLEVLSETHSPQVLTGSFMVVYPETKR